MWFGAVSSSGREILTSGRPLCLQASAGLVAVRSGGAQHVVPAGKLRTRHVESEKPLEPRDSKGLLCRGYRAM